jgi:hypothetical protein
VASADVVKYFPVIVTLYVCPTIQVLGDMEVMVGTEHGFGNVISKI